MLWILFLYAVLNATHATAHLLAARVFGVSVDRVSLGLGPTLWSRESGRTTFRVALLPFPLIVRLRAPWRPGVEGAWPPHSPADLRSRNLGVRLAVFASAPAAILLLAFLAAFWMHGYGTTTWITEPKIGEIRPDTPAARAGLETDDVLEAVNGKAAGSFEELARLIGESEGPVSLTVGRSGRTLSFEVEPDYVEGRRLLGISPVSIVTPAPSIPGRALASASFIADWWVLLFKGVRTLFVGQQTATVGGVVAVSHHQFQTALGIDDARLRASLVVVAILSIFLWCIALPFLDGRRLLFLGIEALARRPLHPKHEQRFNWIGLAVVAVAWVASGVADLARML